MSAKKSKAVAKVPSNDELIAAMPEEQRERVQGLKAKHATRPRRAELKLRPNDGGAYSLDLKGDGADGLETSLLAWDAMGTRSASFLEGNLLKLANMVATMKDAERDSVAVSSAMALIAAIEPQDELEATMAMQMVAANASALDFFSRSRRSGDLDQVVAFSNIANKAMRSFTLGAEAIAKLRRNGEQVVRHVHVNDGGQAVFAGTVHTGGRK